MNRTKIIFFDIDGTLIDMDQKHISEKTLTALTLLQKNGIKLCVAIGRSPMQVPKFPDITFDACLTYNGSYCFTENRDIFSNSLKKADVLSIIKNAESIGRPLSLATKKQVAANGADQDLIDYYGFGGMEIQIAKNFNLIAEQEEIYQIMMGSRKEEYASVMKNVKEAKITAWWDRAVDIIPMNGGKGIGIAKTLQFFNLDKTQAMAFGDGNNDIEMLQAVGTGVAMGNASAELKAVADEICDSVKNDGIYYFCKAKGLI